MPLYLAWYCTATHAQSSIFHKTNMFKQLKLLNNSNVHLQLASQFIHHRCIYIYIYKNIYIDSNGWIDEISPICTSRSVFCLSLSIYIHFINFYVLAVFYLSIYIYIYTKFLSVYTHLSVVTGWSFVESPCQKIMIFMKKPWKREGSTIINRIKSWLTLGEYPLIK